MISDSLRMGLVGLLSLVAVSAWAWSSGYGDSTTGSLETVRPTVSALSVSTTREVGIAFDEPVVGADNPANYAISDHAGNLAANPDVAASAGGSDYTLTWNAGEMLGGGNVTVTVSGVQDAVGNPMNAAFASASAASVFDAPTTGTAMPPATAIAAPIVIPFDGAADASSGIAFVELWVRFDDGSSAWTNTGLTVPAGSGFFGFTPPGAPPDNHGVYYFDLVAQDNAGNRSAEPSGTTGVGDGATTFDTTKMDGWFVSGPEGS